MGDAFFSMFKWKVRAARNVWQDGQPAETMVSGLIDGYTNPNVEIFLCL